jgi:hypothetical protein
LVDAGVGNMPAIDHVALFLEAFPSRKVVREFVGLEIKS